MQEDEAKQLKAIRNARSWLLVCFCTFPVYAVAVTGILNAGNDITAFMLLYMAIYAVFGINASVRKCPNCRQQFYVKKYFLNIFRRQCAHCNLSSTADL